MSFSCAGGPPEASVAEALPIGLQLGRGLPSMASPIFLIPKKQRENIGSSYS
jgi:hypothetical protein